NQERPQASAGSRLALNLSGVNLTEIRRGDTLVAPSSFEAVSDIDVELSLLREAPALKDHSEITFHAFTSGVSGNISLYESRVLQPGETGLAKIKLGQPVVLLPGDRFVLRQPSPPVTIGGGRVLDARPIPKLARRKRLEWLKALRTASREQQVLVRVERRQREGISAGSLAKEAGFSPGSIKDALDSLTASKQVTAAVNESHFIGTPALDSALSQVLAEVKSKAADVLNPGWKRSELRHRTGLNEVVFQFVLTTLEREGKIGVQNDRVVLCGSASPMNPVDSKRLAALAQAYSDAGMNAPLFRSVAEVLKVGEPELRRLMTLLLRDKVLVKVGNEDLYMHRDALAKLYTQVRSLRGQLLDVGRFKQLTGLSRKYAIPLLEHLDREHITRKQGDSRLVL
ncbi:MAG: SelB C-terminal domain-containing protein, partial [Bryobacteraceae bacterium]